MSYTIKELEKISLQARKKILQIICDAGGGHIGGSLSVLDILVTLYFKTMNIDPERPEMEDRDRFILSKGHSVEALYTVLCMRGFFGENVLKTYGRFNSILAGHPTRKVPGVELNSGALGHGLSVGVGMALAAKRSGKNYITYVVMGDGEQAEGSLLEAAAAAGHYQLDNLVAIIDRNWLQISGRTDEVMTIENLETKYQSFGWNVCSCDGHNIKEMTDVFNLCPHGKKKPTMIMARTTKGKGVSFMENKAIWHHKVPDAALLQQAILELDVQLNRVEA